MTFSTIFGTGMRRMAALGSVLPVLALAACSGQGNTMTAPSATGGSTLAKPTSPAPPAGAPDTTVLSFANYVSPAHTVDVNTTTTSDVGQPAIDQGKVQIQVWTSVAGKPSPSSVAGDWVNISGNGVSPVGGATSTPVDLDALAGLAPDDAITTDAGCGDTVSFRAHYITGGGSTKVSTHSSASADITLTCACTTTYGQGYWKTHPGDWPVTSLYLGARSYSQAELISILSDTSNNGNGLVTLSLQLIAAKLNRANGAPNTGDVDAQIALADALIGSMVVPPVGTDWVDPSAVGTIKDALEAYNDSCSDDD